MFPFPKKHPQHKYLGWIGTLIALGDAGIFALGLIPELAFFAMNIVASFFLGWAFFRDKAHYGSFLQLAFIVINAVGVLRILF